MQPNPTTQWAAWKTRLFSFGLAAAFLAFFAAVAALIVQNKPPPQKAEARENIFAVRAAQARAADARPSVLLTGEVQARDYAVLAAPVEAEVLEIAAREGESFPQKRRLARLDLREQRLDIQSRETGVETAKLQIAALANNREADIQRLSQMKNLLDLARREYARNITLQAKNLVAQVQIDNAEQTVNQRRQEFIALQNQVDNYPLEERRMQQQLAAAEVALQQARLLAERGEMRAPFAGKVAKVHASVGGIPARGAAVIEIFNPDTLRLRALVPNRYIAALHGAAARAVLFSEGATLELPVANISPRTEAGQGSVEAFFALPPGGWILGATYEFQLELPPAKGALELPFDALYAESRIYLIGEDGRVQGAECERLGVSRQNGAARALVRCPGVAEGDNIVATQLPGLAEGAKVRILGGAQ
ncbi:MAG: efflux RND transporter periplasmic adaptor subunit [Gammaproteobacteria bacterium]